MNMAAQADRAASFSLTGIEEEFERTGAIGSAQCLWLLEECGRLQRANHALDLAVKDRETELHAKDRDYTGLVSEWQDLADENRRLKQDLEIARLQTGARNQSGEPEASASVSWEQR
jgi:hypothetical protein